MVFLEGGVDLNLEMGISQLSQYQHLFLGEMESVNKLQMPQRSSLNIISTHVLEGKFYHQVCQKIKLYSRFFISPLFLTISMISFLFLKEAAIFNLYEFRMNQTNLYLNIHVESF